MHINMYEHIIDIQMLLGVIIYIYMHKHMFINTYKYVHI
jgi:hypothetical protein